MATYNGEKYLHEQFHSINGQTFNEWDLIVSDDHSSDATNQIISNFKKFSPNNIRYEKGPGEGFVHNFFHLVSLAPKTYDLFFFSDQGTEFRVGSYLTFSNGPVWVNSSPSASRGTAAPSD